MQSSKLSFPKHKIKVLLLENIHQKAAEQFEEDGYAVERLNGTLPEDELIEKIQDVRILGIRSATKLTDKVLQNAHNLLAVGCFCIGTNQVNLQSAERKGIPVFNSPFCNSRSVAELIIAQIINLSRHLGDANNQMHGGRWYKYSKCRREIRGKVLGIIGYGNIGSQVSVLAESMGMRVIFYDVVTKLALGNAQAKSSMEAVLNEADFVTLHVPELPTTKNLITRTEIHQMKKGSYLLNASRGSVVKIEDLADALNEDYLSGAYIDVFPTEPKIKDTQYETVLQNIKNVMLTPHIGGATEEAQSNIGIEVSNKLIKFINEGTSDGAVNFPNISCPITKLNTHRILNVHENIPQVLRSINNILQNYNIERQILNTTQNIGYLIIDVDRKVGDEIKNKIRALDASIKTRILY